MFSSTKIIELGSCAFRQPQAESHCRFLHGYRLTAKFWFSAKSLDQNNWVVDFGGLKGLKEIMKKQFDHTTCVSTDDPHLNNFKLMAEAGVCDLRTMDGVGIEKFAEWCHVAAEAYVDELTDGRCKCTKVEVFEHENNSAIYEAVESDLDNWSSSYKSIKAWANEPDPVTPVAEEKPVNTQDKKHEPLPPGQIPVKKAPGKSSVNTGQSKSTNSWVDPKFAGKTTNTWKF